MVLQTDTALTEYSQSREAGRQVLEKSTLGRRKPASPQANNPVLRCLRTQLRQARLKLDTGADVPMKLGCRP